MNKHVKSPSINIIISLLLSYVIFIAVSLVLFFRIVRNIATGQRFSILLIIFSWVLFILFAGLIIAIFIRSVKDVRKNVSGAQLRFKFVRYFAGISILIFLAQGVLAVILIFNTLNYWLPPQTDKTIKSGINFALQYYNGRVSNLMSFAESDYVSATIMQQDFSDKTKTNKMWKSMRTVNPGIDSIQVLNGSRTLYFAGDIKLKQQIPFNQISPGLSKFEQENKTALYFTAEHFLLNGEKLLVIFSSSLPVSFVTNSINLDELSNYYEPLYSVKDSISKNLIIAFLIFCFPLIFLSILFSLYLSGQILEPLQLMDEAFQRVADGDFSVRIMNSSKDDMGAVLSRFNKMMNEIESNNLYSLNNEKMEAWQDIARRMAHEINNPLTPIRLSSERLYRKYQKDPENFEGVLKKSVTAIISEVNNIENLLKEFRDFAKLPAPNMQKESLKVVIEDAILLFSGYKGKKIIFDISGINDNMVFSFDRNQMKQVFNNLIKNAIEACEDDGKVMIKSSIILRRESSFYRILIEDSGCGIGKDLQDKIFTPYYTTKDYGTGLGLAIVERIVFVHKGRIWFESSEGCGTTFFIDLPIS